MSITVTGGTKTTSGDYTIHSFTSSGDLIVSGGSIDVEYLVVAGGGGGGRSDRAGGGGGAGGLRKFIANEDGNTEAGVITLTEATHTITIGAGGAQSSGNNISGTKGTDSYIANLVTALGGGFGRGGFDTPEIGGSGGGGRHSQTSGGSGTVGQGFDGGRGQDSVSLSAFNGGGGGGAGLAGESGLVNSIGGNGLQSNITGSLLYYAGGGGGARQNNSVVTHAPGGLGGGGGNSAGSHGTDGLGGGGVGGTGNNAGNTLAGRGGSGVVIVRYLTADLGGLTHEAPTNLEATAVSSSAINLTWEHSGTGVVSFELQRRVV